MVIGNASFETTAFVQNNHNIVSRRWLGNQTLRLRGGGAPTTGARCAAMQNDLDDTRNSVAS